MASTACIHQLNGKAMANRPSVGIRFLPMGSYQHEPSPAHAGTGGRYFPRDFFGRPPFLPFSREAACFAGVVATPPSLPPFAPIFALGHQVFADHFDKRFRFDARRRRADRHRPRTEPDRYLYRDSRECAQASSSHSGTAIDLATLTCINDPDIIILDLAAQVRAAMRTALTE